MGLGKISIGNIIGSGDMTGIIYGIGTGPGDPELVTRKAWRIVAAAPVVAYLHLKVAELCPQYRR